MMRENGMVLAREKAAQAWCTNETSGIEMDSRLAEAFARILNDVWSKPWLGNATTGQILDELRARSDLSYKTVGTDQSEAAG